MCALLPFLQGKAGQGNGQGNGRAGRRAIALWSINNGKKRIALILQGGNGGRPQRHPVVQTRHTDASKARAFFLEK